MSNFTSTRRLHHLFKSILSILNYCFNKIDLQFDNLLNRIFIIY